MKTKNLVKMIGTYFVISVLIALAVFGTFNVAKTLVHKKPPKVTEGTLNIPLLPGSDSIGEKVAMEDLKLMRVFAIPPDSAKESIRKRLDFYDDIFRMMQFSFVMVDTTGKVNQQVMQTVMKHPKYFYGYARLKNPPKQEGIISPNQ